jgi:hypothetical protein
MAKQMRKRKCPGCGISSLPTIATGYAKDIVPSPNAARPAKRQAKSVGFKNPRTETISVGLIMCVAYKSGARPIQDTPGRRKRYKITYQENS